MFSNNTPGDALFMTTGADAYFQYSPAGEAGTTISRIELIRKNSASTGMPLASSGRNTTISGTKRTVFIPSRKRCEKTLEGQSDSASDMTSDENARHPPDKLRVTRWLNPCDL